MKKKYVAILMGIVMTAAMLSGCGQQGNTENTTPNTSVESNGEEQQSDEVLGEVTEVGEDSITIAVGTKKDMGEAPGGGSGQNGEKPEGEAPTGENGEKPEGEAPGGENGEKPEGEAPSGDNEEKSGGEASSGDNEEKPEGEAPSGGSGENGEKPEGEAPSGENGEKPEGEAPGGGNGGGEKPSMLDLTGEEKTISITDSTVITKTSMGKPGDDTEDSSKEESTETIALSDISVGDTVSVTLDEDGTATAITVQSMGGGMGGAPSQSQGVDSYEAANEYKEDTTVEGEELTSTNTDENAVLVDEDANVSLKNVTVSRESSDSKGGDNSSFYGVGAAILGTAGNTYISDSTITTDAAGGAGVFAYGDGKVYVADTDITTTKDTSGGIHAAGGGSLYAWDLNVETSGESSAAIRSDRGGGTMVVDGGTYTSNGVGSPAVYCTADIAVNNSKLTANGSEAVCIEGLNSLRLYDCDITGNMSDDSQNDTTWTMIVYQSMSGDSEVGNSTLQVDGGSITSKNGGLLYTTNTECTITLKDVDITYSDDSEYFLQCTGNNNQRGWGQSGSNGSDCLFTAIKQDMKGNVIWDSISDLDFYMTEGSSLTGAVVKDDTYAGDGGEGYCNMYIANGCVWTVTGDSTLSSLSCEGDIVDESGKSVSIVGSDGTVYVEGDSEYTITVDSYSDSADTSGATTVNDWQEYATEKPEAL